MKHGRRDSNEKDILRFVEGLGGLWLPSGPLDGWLWDRNHWHLCEVKRPDKQGWKDEFTQEQKLLMVRLNARRARFHVLRTEDDVLELLNAKISA